jgi:hypothetical protein
VTPAETARLLAKIQAYDRRTVGKADIAAWHEAIGDVPYSEALFAVAVHFRSSTEWLLPARLRELVKSARVEQRRQQPHETRALPSKFETDEERTERIRRGVAMCRAAIRLPETKPARPQGRSDDLHAAALERAMAERRPHRDDPVPLRRLAVHAINEIRNPR